MSYLSLLLPITVLCLTSSTMGERVLMLTTRNMDHLIQFHGLTTGLEHLGHNVTIVADGQNKDVRMLFRGMNASFLYPNHSTDWMPDLDYLYWDENYEATFVEKYLKVENTEECMKVIYDENLFTNISTGNFSLAVVDSSMFCYYLIPYKLGIPYISLGTSVYPYLMRMHPLLAVEPCLLKDDSDSFISRIYRLVNGIYSEITPKLLLDESQFSHAVPDNPFYSLREVATNSALWFVIRDPVLDCPLPTMPNVVQIGSLTSFSSTSLPADVVRFIQSADDGVILVWFSSILSNLTTNIQNKFTQVFHRSSQKFLWIVPRGQMTMPSNVRVLYHVTGSTALSSCDCKLAISDCHTAAVSEAIRHAVPLLCLPVLAEHRYNAYRVITKGIGLHADIRKLTVTALTKRINKLMTSSSFREEVSRLSSIQRSLPRSITQAAFWADHVIRYGSDHLTTSAVDQSLYKYLMVDIFLFICASVIVVYYLCKGALRLMRKSGPMKRFSRQIVKPIKPIKQHKH